MSSEGVAIDPYYQYPDGDPHPTGTPHRSRPVDAHCGCCETALGYSTALLQLWHNDLTITAAQIVRQPTYVAVVREVPVAVGMLGAHPDGIKLVHLWVRPDLIGSGVGRQLFTHLCQIARTGGFSQVYIEADPHAVGFYERMGAVQIGSVATPHGRSLPLLRYELPPAAPAGV